MRRRTNNGDGEGASRRLDALGKVEIHTSDAILLTDRLYCC